MITAVLAAVFIGCLLAGQIPEVPLVVICAAAGLLLAGLGRHHHTSILSIDVFAQKSRLRKVNATLKFWTLFFLILISVASKNWTAGIFLMLAAAILAVCIGGMEFHDYIQIMALPVSFLMIGGVALLFDIKPEQTGVISFHALGVWFCVTEAAQEQTALVVSRALGAVSCLILLSITTPMPEIISVMRRVRCPRLIIDLMYLIYRYIFILLNLHHAMLDAAKSRLGFRDYRSSLRATGKIHANLFARSYQFASKNFDAMESRCYDTGIRFLGRRNKIKSLHVAASVGMVMISLYCGLLL